MHHLLRLRNIIVSLTAVLVLVSAGYLLLIKMVDLETYRDQILSELQGSLRRSVTYQSGNLTFNRGPAISFHGIVVKEPGSQENFVIIDTLTCRLDLFALLKKQISIHGLVAEKASIRLERFADGTFNISDLLESGKSEGPTLTINQIKLKDAVIKFTDGFVQQPALVTTLTKTDLSLGHIARGAKGNFKIAANLDGGASGTVALHGNVRIAATGSPLSDSTVHTSISCSHLDVSHFWPYYRPYVPFKKILGVLEISSEFHGKLTEFASSGKISLRSFRFDYQPIFSRIIASESIALKYEMELNKADISVNALEGTIDGAEVKGRCAIKDYRSGDPRIIARAVTSPLDFNKFKQYVPYGVIVKDPADWIAQHIAGGNYQLEEGRLDGRVSQILHMESGENYNVLYIRARAEKGLVTYGNSVPTFNNIKGILELKGKDFFLHNMSGKFGDAPLTLEGKITDYPLDKACSYPFRMTISPGKNEISWLLGKKRAAELTYNGSSILNLAGEGYTSGYTLAGNWDLSPAAYSYANLIAKPIGTSSSITFKGSISPEETTLSSLTYRLNGHVLDLSARYPFKENGLPEITLKTSTVPIEQIAKLSPLLNRYQPSGQVQLTARVVLAESSGNSTWKGKLNLNNAAFRYSQTEKPVTALTGTVSFSHRDMETSHLTARIGNTVLVGKGALSNFNPVVFTTSFSAPRIDLADFGFKLPSQPLLATNVNGEFSFKEHSLAISSLSGTFNKSQLNVRGLIHNTDNYNADLTISAPYLEIADMLLFAQIERVGAKTAKNESTPTVKAVVRADKGSFRGTSFEKGTATVNYSGNSLQIYPLQANILGGRLAAKVEVEPQATPRMRAEFMLANGSAEEITHLFSDKKEITGIMTLEGNIAARIESIDTLKKSVSGSIKVHASRGVLNHFSGLSKVFSILNVSQLLRFRLPDMVSTGMPFNEIKGTLSLKEGAVTTNDLFLASHAMNMSLVGTYDVTKDNMEITLGIQPLQTVDKVVSTIPIVGWVLTGKEKSLITTYFEIKGKSTDPQVSAIPVKSISKGVLGIFKRVFQLPAKIVTDTGEVILGK